MGGDYGDFTDLLEVDIAADVLETGVIAGLDYYEFKKIMEQEQIKLLQKQRIIDQNQELIDIEREKLQEKQKITNEYQKKIDNANKKLERIKFKIGRS